MISQIIAPDTTQGMQVMIRTSVPDQTRTYRYSSSSNIIAKLEKSQEFHLNQPTVDLVLDNGMQKSIDKLTLGESHECRVRFNSERDVLRFNTTQRAEKAGSSSAWRNCFDRFFDK